MMDAETTDFLVKELKVDQSVERIVRTMQEKLMGFYLSYESYKNSADMLHESHELREELPILMSLHGKLREIHTVCLNELSGFRNAHHSAALASKNKVLYDIVLLNLTNMVNDMDSYIKSLEMIIKYINEFPGRITVEKFKAGFSAAFDILHKKYDSFIKADKNLMDAINKLVLIGRNN